MERSFSLNCEVHRRIKTIGLILLSISLFFSAHAQNVMSSSLLRFPVWFSLESSPSIEINPTEDTTIFSGAAKGIRELAPYFVGSLVYGWEFSYTPSDNARGVNEYFEIKPIVLITEEDDNMTFTDSVVASDSTVVETWVEYTLTTRMVYERSRWHSASFPTIGGRGESSVFDGVQGVRSACENAAKSAIREYARMLIKNKPKEINGKILLIDFPRYYIDAGKYVADLDFFLNVSKIVEYTKF